MSENPAPKIASDPDWFWRELGAGRGVGLYGEILPERPKLEPEIVPAIEASPAAEGLAL